MPRKLLPIKWEIEHLTIEDSTIDEVGELQQIYDQVPQTQGFMHVEG